MRPALAQTGAHDGPVTTDREAGRAEVADRGLTAIAAERVVRVALGQLPVSLVSRATTQLRRYFSGGSWSASDDAALSAAVGPGKGWYTEELDTDLAMSFGWRGGAFRLEVSYTPEHGLDDDATDLALANQQRSRALGDTFEDTIVIEPGRSPNELRFGTGPGPGPAALFTRETADRDPRVAALFRACPDLDQVSIGAGSLTANISDPTRWSDVLLALFDAITAGFVQPRATPPDRQLERAQRELGTLSPDSPRDLARIIDATTSPDAAFRRVAIARLERADAVVGRAPLRRALEDSSRAVRRAGARALAATAAPETRDLLEQALDDADACVRYYGVTGLARIGVSISLPSLQARIDDPDVRVRLAVEAALEGRIPA